MNASTGISSAGDDRRLQDLISVGPAMLRDFELLQIRSVDQLASADPEQMYSRLCRLTGEHQDVCCLDVFRAAVAQARDPCCRPSSANGGTGAVSGRPAVPRGKRKLPLTIPDLVLLSLLAERPMHGYQANLELERRQVRDWAGVSRPQVYYSLEKLDGLGFIRSVPSKEPAAGPDRTVFSTTAAGRTALADALERPDWTTQSDRPAFLTWVALSWQARQSAFKRQLQRRREFLESELKREEGTLRSVLEEVGHPHHEAVWMLRLVIQKFHVEQRWLDKVESELSLRAPAHHPDYAPE